VAIGIERDKNPKISVSCNKRQHQSENQRLCLLTRIEYLGKRQAPNMILRKSSYRYLSYDRSVMILVTDDFVRFFLFLIKLITIMYDSVQKASRIFVSPHSSRTRSLAQSVQFSSVTVEY